MYYQKEAVMRSRTLQVTLWLSVALVILGLQTGKRGTLLAGEENGTVGEVQINGGFEKNLVGWSISAGVEIDQRIFKSGKKSLQITRMPEHWNTASQERKIDGSDFYRIEAWIKIRNAAQTHFKVNWLDKNAKKIITSFVCQGLDGDKDWFKVSKSTQAPKEAVAVEIQCFGGGSLDKKNPGVSWFDEIKLIKFQAARKNLTQAEWLKITQAKYGRDMVALPMKEKVVYYDKRHDGSGVFNVDELLTFLNSRGFITKDADVLKSWMQEKIAKGADGTVCIMAMGMVPDTITETPDTKCTFQRYLDAGGRAVWIGDIPLMYQTYIDKPYNARWGKDVTEPALVVLGIENGKWNMIDNRTTITEIGEKWGMQVVDAPLRTIKRSGATLIFSEVSGTPYTCSYFKNYNTEFPYSGFIRYSAANNHDGTNAGLNNDLYRVALYRGKPITVPEVMAEVKTDKVELVTIETMLRNYPRGMSIPITVRINEKSGADEVTLQIEDDKEVVRKFESPANRENLFNLATYDLASGDYVLAVELLKDSKVITRTEKKIFIAPKKVDKLPIGMYAVSGGSSEYKSDVILKDLKDHLGECGVITGDSGYLADEALRYGLRIMPKSNAYYANVISRKKHPELHMRVSTGNLPEYHYGEMGRAPICMGNPINREKINATFKEEITEALKYPAFMKRMFVSDDAGLFGDPAEHRLACYCDYCKNEFKKLTGFEAPLAPCPEILKTKGVVDDNDPWYIWMKFRSNNTYGGWNRSMEKAKNEIDPEIKFGPIPAGGHAPVFRPGWGLNPPDNYGGIGLVSFYWYPERKTSLPLMTHSAGGMMGNRDKELWVIPQASLFNDPVVQLRAVKNEFYYLLAAGVSGMSYFHYPPMPGTAAWEEFKTFSKIGTRFGPLLLKLKKSPRQVAVLASYCNASFQWAQGRGGNLPAIYSSLLKSHISADMIADEEVLNDILGNYKVLVLNDVDYLTESVYKRITSFIANGGIVFADESCEIHIPDSKTIRGDRGESEMVLAQSIRRIISPFVEISTSNLIMSEFVGNKAKYLILVNYRTDKATSGELTLKGITDYHLYDIFTGQKIENKGGKFNVILEPAGGKLIGIYPASIKAISVQAPETVSQGQKVSLNIKITGAHGKPLEALLPVRVSIKTPDGNDSEYSDHYVAKNGTLDISFIPAVNDIKGTWEIEVEELSSEKSSKEYFLLE